MRRLFPTLVLLALAPVAALAAPPPPPRPIEATREPVDGYDLGAVWSRWNDWVEQEKGPVTEALLAEPETIPGEKPWGGPVLEFRKRGDQGHFMTGEVRVYCKFDLSSNIIPGSCHYRFRRAFVAPDAAGYSGRDGNAVSRWTVQAFDPFKLVAHFKRSGLAPDTDWWRVDQAALFSVLPSPEQVLRENATVVHLDSRDCPAFQEAMEALDGKSLTTRLDMRAIGEDGQWEGLAPHATVTNIKLNVVESGGGILTLEGFGGVLRELAAPVFAATDACEKALRKP